MERNWLIRTAQNQILGPVSKAKLIEFIQKGALGLTDEVTSGNGYWLSIKEKDLLEKYIFGDVPQSYNPISEAMTVLANKENPDKTSSINHAPANMKSAAVARPDEKVTLPSNDDLEFPDMGSSESKTQQDDITTFTNLNDLKKNLNNNVLVPNNSDLEFPTLEESNVDDDITRVAQIPSLQKVDSDELKFEVPKEYKAKTKVEAEPEIKDAILPNQEDLEFPDLAAIVNEKKEELEALRSVVTQVQSQTLDQTSTKIDPDSMLNLDLDFTSTVALKDSQARDILDTPKVLPKAPTSASVDNNDVKIALHERKPKANTKVGSRKKIEELRDPKREQVYTKIPESGPKKRNDTYLFFILFLLIIIIAGVFYYFKEILNKPLPV